MGAKKKFGQGSGFARRVFEGATLTRVLDKGVNAVESAFVLLRGSRLDRAAQANAVSAEVSVKAMGPCCEFLK